MFEQDYDYYANNLQNLSRFTLCGVTYAPFVPTKCSALHFDGKPDMFWHLTTSSKERDCTNNSPIVPCCNTIEMAGCQKIENVDEVHKVLHRIPCPYRAAAMKSIRFILDRLSLGDFQGIAVAIFLDQDRRQKMVIRRRCGCLDYVCIFKCYPVRYEAKNTVRPLRLITAFPLAYRSAIAKFDKLIERSGLPIS